MLKIKDVDLIDFETLRIGAIAYVQIFLLSILLAIIPLGVLLYFNLSGWVASRIYKQPEKFLSKHSLMLGLRVTWRYIIFIVPFSALLIMLNETLAKTTTKVIFVDAFLLFLFSIISMGWAIRRAGIVTQKEFENELKRYQIDSKLL